MFNWSKWSFETKVRVIGIALIVFLVAILAVHFVAASAEASEPSTCNVEGGVQIEAVSRNDGKWMIGRDATSCNLLFEGRLDESQIHHIYVLRSLAEDGPYWDPDGNFIFLEGSLWTYPRTWNMDNFAAEKVPIAGEFVNAKRHNMVANGYDWMIMVHGSDGTLYQFDPGIEIANVQLPDNCAFDQPEKLEVAGVYNPKYQHFRASIGAEGCWTVAWVNGNKVEELTWVFKGAEDDVSFSTIETYMFPSSWGEAERERWIMNQIGGQ